MTLLQNGMFLSPLKSYGNDIIYSWKSRITTYTHSRCTGGSEREREIENCWLHIDICSCKSVCTWNVYIFSQTYDCDMHGMEYGVNSLSWVLPLPHPNHSLIIFRKSTSQSIRERKRAEGRNQSRPLEHPHTHTIRSIYVYSMKVEEQERKEEASQHQQCKYT
jgi:hypothetical protein